MGLKYEVIRESLHIMYHRYGAKHRCGAPALLWHCGDMVWREYGVFHRLNGPASISRRYFIRGKEYTKKEYESKIRSTM